MKASFGNKRFADPLAGIDTTKTEVKQEPAKPAVTGDPWEWYCSELERVLGKQRGMDFTYADSWYNSFTEHLKNLPSEADLVAGVGDQSGFPIKHTPEFIQKFSKELASYAGVPVSIPFLATVAMLSSALGRNLRIQSGRDRYTPGNIYAALFLTSGVCKSEIYDKVSKPLTERHRADRERYFAEIEPELQAELELVKLGLEKLGKQAKSNDGLTSEEKCEFKYLMKQKAVLELKMKPPEYYAEDYTIEALGAILSRNGEQLAAISPEASKPIQNLKGLYKDGNVEDTIYNKAYSLEAGKIDRISREANEFHEPCLAVLWLTQPDKIPTIFNDSGLVKGGLTPRLIALHESVEIQHADWDSKYLDPRILKEYENLWQELFEAYRLGGECVPEDENDGLEDVPWQRKFAYRMVITDKEIGRRMFEHFNNLVDRRNSDLQDIQQFPARWTENAWRIALIFHASKYGKNAHTVKMEAETCDAALEIMDWFARGQLQLLGRGRVEEIEGRCEHLREIVAKQPNKRLSFGKLKDNHGFEPAELRQLAGASNGKLRIVEPAKGGKGGRPTRYVEAA